MSEETINSSKTARILFSKTSTQEKDLASNLKKRNPGDKSITQLRNEIRDNYEKIIFLDMEFAASKDVDQLLWKSVFYKAIEEFRKIIKKYQSNTDASKAATVKEKLQKTFAAFTAFLTEAVAYFETLQEKLGQVKFDKDESKFKQIQSAMMHKCFIILGDLSRYQQLYTDTLTKNWTIASNYYHKALELMPTSGNAQNQLAVIATYAEDEFEAVYRYFRSLAVAKPFISARENLLLLFEQSRLRYIKTFGKQQKNNNMPKAFKKNKKATAQPNKNTPQSKKQLVEKFLLCFVRLHGILFSKIGLELFDELQEETSKNLDELLKSQLLSEAALLKIVIMCIFAIENATKNAKELASYTLNFVFSVMSSLTRYAGTIPSQTLGAVTVFLRYAAQHTATFVQSRKDGQFFWVATANMLNSLPKVDGVKHNSALEEDAELLGFAPLSDSEKNASPAVTQEVPTIRIKRAIESAHAIAKVESMNFILEKDTFMALEDDQEENLNEHAKSVYDFVDDSEQTAFAEDDNEVPVDVEQSFVGANFAMQNEDDEVDNLDGAEDVIDVLEHNGSATTTMMPAMAHSYASNSTKVISSPTRYQDSQGGLFSTSSFFAPPPVQQPQQDNYFGNQWYGNNMQQQDGYGRTIKRPDANAAQPITNAGFTTWGSAQNLASFAQPFGAYPQQPPQQQQQPQSYPFFSNAPQNGYQQKKSFIS